MTASVLIHHPVHGGDSPQHSQQPADGRTTDGRHGGWQDCGCRRAGCHDEFAALAATSDARARTATRDRLIEAHLELAYSIARHYHRAGPGSEDIRQVAALALVEAVNRFDPDLGTAFSAFAVPTITGAIKRHFRDQRWTVHPPRRIKELRLRIRAATELLAQQMRRTPTVADLADHLDCGQQDICEALCTDDALRPLSIDAPVRAAGDDTTLSATLGCPEAGYARVENLETLRTLLAKLPERELRVITMRFAGNLTQAQIAERVGCSQMHVSRILRAALDRLRHSLQDGCARLSDDDTGDPVPHRRDVGGQPDSAAGARDVPLVGRPGAEGSTPPQNTSVTSSHPAPRQGWVGTHLSAAIRPACRTARWTPARPRCLCTALPSRSPPGATAVPPTPLHTSSLVGSGRVPTRRR